MLCGLQLENVAVCGAAGIFCGDCFKASGDVAYYGQNADCFYRGCVVYWTQSKRMKEMPSEKEYGKSKRIPMLNQTDSQILRESEYTYDQKFKQLFQNKKFLAPILKNVVAEYKELPLEEIESLILSVKGDEEVAVSLAAEDVGKGEEAKTFYDVMAGCRYPGTEEEFVVDLYFDLEMQRENNPGYPVPKRGVYYCKEKIIRDIRCQSGESIIAAGYSAASSRIWERRIMGH